MEYEQDTKNIRQDNGDSNDKSTRASIHKSHIKEPDLHLKKSNRSNVVVNNQTNGKHPNLFNKAQKAKYCRNQRIKKSRCVSKKESCGRKIYLR